MVAQKNILKGTKKQADLFIMTKKKQTGKKSIKGVSTSRTTVKKEKSWWTNARTHPWIILLFSFVLYANTLGHDYTQDDAIVIYDNMFTTSGIKGIPGILKYDTFYGFFKVEGKNKLVAGGRYRPLTLVMFAVEYALFGNNPFIGHLMNVLLYGLLGVILYLVLTQLFHQNISKNSALIAIIATLLFVAHPIHTEVVANIKGRDEIMSLLGSLTALLLSFKAYDKNNKWFNILAGITFFLGLMSKENAITFLAIVPLAYYIFRKISWIKIIQQILPFIIAAILFLIIRGQVLGGNFGGTESMELMNNPFLKIEGGRWIPLAFGEKMATIFYTLGKYIQLLLFPHPLTHDYYPRHINLMEWNDWPVILSLLTYLALGGLAFLGLLKKRIWSFSILFYLITLSIVSNIVFPIGTNMSERFLFMPSIGFALLLALIPLYPIKNKVLLEVYSKPLLIFTGLLLVLYSTKTIQRNQTWKDNLTLFTTDIEVSKNSAKLRNAVGGDLSSTAIKIEDETTRNAMLQEAIGHLKEAVKIHPTYKNAYLLLGNTHNYLKQYDQSIQYYDQALRLDPGYTDAFNNRAITYRDAGFYFGQQLGDLNKAKQYLEEAIKSMPEDYETVFGLGVAEGMGGNINRAIELFTKSTQIQPNSAAAWRNLGNAYMNAGDQANANIAIQKANALENK